MHRHTILLTERMRGADRVSERDAVTPQARKAAPAPAPDTEENAHAIACLRQSIAEFETLLQSQRAKLADEIARASVELAVQIAERLLGAEIAGNRQRLDQIVLSSLERIQPARAIIVKLNPLDLELLQQQLAENAVPDRFAECLTFQRDDACPRGRLKLETDELFLEWDTQRSLAELRHALLEEIYTEAAIP